MLRSEARWYNFTYPVKTSLDSKDASVFLESLGDALCHTTLTGKAHQALYMFLDDSCKYHIKRQHDVKVRSEAKAAAFPITKRIIESTSYCEKQLSPLPKLQIHKCLPCHEIWCEAECPFRGLKRRGGSPLEHHHESRVHHEWLPSTWACPQGIFLMSKFQAPWYRFAQVFSTNGRKKNTQRRKKRTSERDRKREKRGIRRKWRSQKRGRIIRRSQYIIKKQCSTVLHSILVTNY